MRALWTILVSGLALSALLSCGVVTSRPRVQAAVPRGSKAEPFGGRRAVVVSIDGLMPAVYLNPDALGLRVPEVRRLAAEGLRSEAAHSVYPSLTYPSHTTIASGVRPVRHGIHGNIVVDPLGSNADGWHWYAEEVRVPRLWDYVRDAGGTAAVIHWPVTVGIDAAFHVPEVWRARTAEDLRLIRALSEPSNLLDEVAKASPGFWEGYRPQAVTDEAGMTVALHLLASAQPSLTMLHIWQVDAAQHRFGIGSPEARAAIENADVQLTRLRTALAELGLTEKTLVAVVSDHGFAPVERCVRPGALLRKAGLIDVDAEGKVTGYRAWVHPNHGSAYVYVPEQSADALRQVKGTFTDPALAQEFSLIEASEIARRGGDPAASFALDAAPGVSFGAGIETYSCAPAYVATHGYDPELPQMRASLLLKVPGIDGKVIAADLVDVAPTVAAWLGLREVAFDGRSLLPGD